jgi:methyltransferase (TIGR00027 family)
MVKSSVEYKPSKTALGMALRRAIAHKEYKNDKFGPDYLAEYFLPLHNRFFFQFRQIRNNTKNDLEVSTPGLYSYAIARTTYFDNLFKNALINRFPQIVILGAGYDSRAYRFKNINEGTKIYEVDISTTQNRKKRYLKYLLPNSYKNVNFVSINLSEQSLEDCLEKSGYKQGEKTLFIWEGVTYYLDPEVIDLTLKYIRSCTKDSIIGFDYIISIIGQNISNYYGVKEFVETMEKYHKNEELKFVIKDGEIESFLRERKFKMVNYLDNKEIENVYLKDVKGKLIGRITGFFRFVSASPN